MKETKSRKWVLFGKHILISAALAVWYTRKQRRRTEESYSAPSPARY